MGGQKAVRDMAVGQHSLAPQPSQQELGLRDLTTRWEVALFWSPCGSQLVVGGPGMTTFQCFD